MADLPLAVALDMVVNEFCDHLLDRVTNGELALPDEWRKGEPVLPISGRREHFDAFAAWCDDRQMLHEDRDLLRPSVFNA
jgi:hypothetical protein